MIKPISLKIFAIFICYALAYSPFINAAQLSLPSGDLIAPEITQSDYAGTVTEGKDYAVSVKVTDNIAVKQVVLYYRATGTEQYQRKLMQNMSGTDNYRVSIQADEISKPGIEYYIQAVDNAGNSLLHGYSFSPLSVKMLPDGDALADNTTAVSEIAAAESAADDGSIFTNKWFWIGVGVLVAGAAASSSGGGGGGTPTATLTIDAGEPVN